MGSRAHPQFHALIADVKRHFPKATLAADTMGEPLMITVANQGCRVRDFISSADLSERGEPYRKLLDRLLRQLVDGQKDADLPTDHGGDYGGQGAPH